MTPGRAVRRWPTGVTAVVLCCLAGSLPNPLNGPQEVPGVAVAAEKRDAPTNKPEPGDPAKDRPDQSEAPENGEDIPPGDGPDESDADESEEIFVPSEDISEDIDVPFPVDI